MKYKVTCVNCKNIFPVEITDRQRHEEDFDLSLEYAHGNAGLPNSDDVLKVAIAMYEQKCLDHRSNKIQKSKEDITRTINQAKKYK